MPLPPLTPRTAVVGLVGAAWLGATIGLVDHVLSAPDPVTYFAGKVVDPPGAATGVTAGVARLPQQLQHVVTGGSSDGAKVRLIPAPSASPSATSSPVPPASAAAVRISPTAFATASPSATTAASPMASPSPTEPASPGPSPTPTPAALASYSDQGNQS